MWFLYALAFAILSSFVVVIAKKIMKEVDEYTYLLFHSVFAFPFLAGLTITFYGLPQLDRVFWTAVVVGTTISVVAAILAYKAIRISEISLVGPISAFNPVFTAIIAYMFLKETISLRQVLGILTIVLGAYVLQLSKTKKGAFAPIKALLVHKGVRLSFVAYFLWGITPLFEKTAIFHTFPQNPPFAALAGQIVAMIFYIPIVAKLSTKPIQKVKKLWKIFLISGFVGGLAITAAFITFSISSLGVATAVFKLSLIIIPILGWLFFKERNIKDRLLGSAIMLVGVVLLVS